MNGRGQCLDLRSHPADQFCLSYILFDELCVLSFRKAQLFFQHGYYPPVIHEVKVWIIMRLSKNIAIKYLYVNSVQLQSLYFKAFP